jgi:hypothetical protein
MSTDIRLTNSDIAETLDMSVSGVSRLRSGTRQASVRIAGAIIDAYCSTPELRQEGMAALASGGQRQAEFLSSLWG